MQFKLIVLLIAAGYLTACSGESKNDSSATSGSAESKTVSKKPTFIDPQLKALEKAKLVEQSLQNEVDKRHQEMLKQGI